MKFLAEVSIFFFFSNFLLSWDVTRCWQWTPIDSFEWLCDGPAWPLCPAGPRLTPCFHCAPVNLVTVVAVSSSLPRLPGGASEQTRGVSDGLQASCRRRLRFQSVSPHLSPSRRRLSTDQRGYRAAKTNCLAHKTNTRPCASHIQVMLEQANMEKKI